MITCPTIGQRQRDLFSILAECEKIGYTGPNKAAQILRKGRSNIVALILADSIAYTVSDPVASTFIKGVSRVLQQQGKHLLNKYKLLPMVMLIYSYWRRFLT